MLKFFLSLINPIKAISNDILEWKLKAKDAETEQKRIEAVDRDWETQRS